MWTEISELAICTCTLGIRLTFASPWWNMPCMQLHVGRAGTGCLEHAPCKWRRGHTLPHQHSNYCQGAPSLLSQCQVLFDGELSWAGELAFLLKLYEDAQYAHCQILPKHLCSLAAGPLAAMSLLAEAVHGPASQASQV